MDPKDSADLLDELDFQANTAHLSEREYQQRRAERTREKKAEDVAIIGFWVVLTGGAFIIGAWPVGIVFGVLLGIALYRTR